MFEATRSELVASPGERVLVGAFVEPALKRTLVTLARRNDRSVSAEIRTALRRHLREPGALDAPEARAETGLRSPEIFRGASPLRRAARPLT